MPYTKISKTSNTQLKKIGYSIKRKTYRSGKKQNKIPHKTKASKEQIMQNLFINIIANNSSNTQTFQSHLATVLSTIQLYQKNGENTIIDEEFEQQVIRQNPIWEKYLLEAKQQLLEAINIFKTYDHKKLLTKFFQKIQQGQLLSANNRKKYYDIVMQYALEAYENKTWNDAYFMLFFITSFFPTYAKPYLLLGQATEEIKGLDQASEFYKSTCELLKDPDFYFLAAECEIKLEHKDKAKEYLTKIKEILGNASGLSDENQELLQGTNEILELIDKEA